MGLIVTRTLEECVSFAYGTLSTIIGSDAVWMSYIPCVCYMIYCRDLRNDYLVSFLALTSAGTSLPALPLLPLP
jgi:hypothetical protein